jgi:hypothetical protein
MVRVRIGYWADVAALVSALLVFPTGLILLAWFHVGPEGQQRMYGLGLSRTAWIDLHRCAAMAMTAAVAVHVELHGRVIVARLQRAYRRLPGRALWSDLVLYLGFAAVTLAAFGAWLVLPRSLHHPAIDLHNVAALILLAAVVVHVRRHFRWLLR